MSNTALITSKINPQGFEVVRDAIGAILKLELENQKILWGFSEPINVYVGYSSNFQQSDVLLINVLYDSSNNSNHNQFGMHQDCNYSIDIYCSSKETEENTGDFLSTQRRDKFAGFCSAILSDHHYRSLGFTDGQIMGTSVESSENFESKNENDAAFVKMCRISFNVRINQNFTSWSGISLSDAITGVKLYETEKGFRYELTN